VFSEKLQLDLPDTFPNSEYEEFRDASRAVLLPDKGAPWKEFAGASNLIGWRFRACSEYCQNYVASWREFGTDVTFEELYSRERSMFGMFVSGVSCIESITYAVAALASHPQKLALPFGDLEQRQCNPRRLKDRLDAHAAAAPIIEALDRLLGSTEWRLWLGLRNRMTHRSNVPRRHYASVGSTPLPENPVHFGSTSSTPDFVGDEVWFENQLSWFIGTVKDYLHQGKRFARGA
jgi:hypothetical protein